MATKPSSLLNLKEEKTFKRENKDHEGMFGFRPKYYCNIYIVLIEF